MKIVIAPDSFKESLSAQEVAEAIYEGLYRVWPEHEYVCVPVADGGEGTVQALIDATGGKKITTDVCGPRGETVHASYGILGDGTTAVIEIAEACGLHLVPKEERDPKSACSYGVGQLVRHALDLGIHRLIVGLGGSATNDGGVGMLKALGARFYRDDGTDISAGGAGLLELHRIDISQLEPRLANCEILIACDVDNPLCGELGASAIFGTQKGAHEKDITILDKALTLFAQHTMALKGKDILNAKGAGAAGGIGAAWLGYTNATLKSGIDIVLETVNLKKQLLGASLVITGEGRIDHQTPHGKTPMGVAVMAKTFNIPVIAVAGCIGDNYQAVYRCGIDAVFTCLPRAMPLADALQEAKVNLSNVAENIARLWQVSHS